ncbi:hypothetical protein EDB84DRAFT_1438626 [Lactarius hengduanensis]|nr:hypothetical protein EDB84DRAFT_1438626 [Lactarius hengduanensis]
MSIARPDGSIDRRSPEPLERGRNMRIRIGGVFGIHVRSRLLLLIPHSGGLPRLRHVSFHPTGYARFTSGDTIHWAHSQVLHTTLPSDGKVQPVWAGTGKFVTLAKPVPVVTGHRSRVSPGTQVAGPDAAATCQQTAIVLRRSLAALVDCVSNTFSALPPPRLPLSSDAHWQRSSTAFLGPGNPQFEAKCSNHVLGAAPTSPRAGLYCHHHLWLASANSTSLQRARAAMPHRDTTTPAWRASLATTTATPPRRYDSDTAPRRDEDSDTARGAATSTRRVAIRHRHGAWRYDIDTARGATTATRRVALRQRHGAWRYDSNTARGVTKTSTRRMALRQRHSAWRYDSDTARGATTATRRRGVTKTAPRHGEDNDTAPPYGEDSNTVPRHGEYGDTAPWPLVYKSIVRFRFNPSPNLNRTNVNLNQWFGSGFGLDP